LPFVAARENIATFMERLFGEVDLSDRSLSGVIKLAKFGRKYINDPEYVQLQRSDVARAFKSAKEFAPDALIVPDIVYGGYVAIAEALRIPVITFGLQINHPTPDYPLFQMRVDSVPRWLNSGLYRLKGFLYPKMWRAQFEAAREIVGINPRFHDDGTKYKIWPHDFPQVCALPTTIFSQPTGWPKHKTVSGSWVLTDDTTYSPPQSLTEFLQKAPVYIGFGSMKSSPEFRMRVSSLVIGALYEADRPGVLLGGWAGLSREALDTSTPRGHELYAWAKRNVYEIQECPHDWLFPQCSVIVHHGGAGTFSASLRSSRPSVVCAFQGDQPFYGSLTEAKGLGRYLGIVGSSTVTSESLGAAIIDMAENSEVRERTARTSALVRAEDGVTIAADFIDSIVESHKYPWPTPGSGAST
jgi:sterol 3beta-glucosyltransferase